MKISIITPVFNAEGTLPRCLDSLAGQDLTDIEFVFVDDCSTDGSAALINSFADRTEASVKLIRHQSNRGVASARNTGLDAATGDYLCFVDADDTLSGGAIRKAASTAEETGADIIGWDWVLCRTDSTRHMRQAEYRSPAEALEKMMKGTIRWNLWLFLTKRQLWLDNGIRFLDGQNMGEDMMATIKLLSKASSSFQLHDPLYRYDATLDSSISRQFSQRRRDEVGVNVAETERWLKGTVYEAFLPFLKLNVKLPLLVSGSRDDLRTWRSWYAEAGGYVMKNEQQALRTRLLQVAASYNLYPAIRLYKYLLDKLAYGFIFKHKA